MVAYVLLCTIILVLRSCRACLTSIVFVRHAFPLPFLVDPGDHFVSGEPAEGGARARDRGLHK